MSPLRLMIVDDEPLARLRLRTLVQDLHVNAGTRWTVAAEAANADEALLQLRRQNPDEPLHALLLDVRMPGRSGLQLAHALRSLQQPPVVVFVTAHAEHALTAFELDAVDYLTKPVRRERLAQALQRVQQRVLTWPGLASLAASVSTSVSTSVAASAWDAVVGPTVAADAPAATTAKAAAGVLLIHERDRMLRLPVAELLYFRADQKQVLLRTAGSSHLIDDSLSELEDKLAALGGHFIRVHRNALVALAAMRELALRTSLPREQTESGDGWAVRVAPLDEWLSVSRRQVAAVKAALADGGS